MHAGLMWQKITPDSFSSESGIFTKVVGDEDLYLLYSSTDGESIYSYADSEFSELPITSGFDTDIYIDIQDIAYANELLFVGWETVEGLELWSFDGVSWAIVDEPFLTFTNEIQLMDTLFGGSYLFIAIHGSLGEEDEVIGLAYDGDEIFPIFSGDASGIEYDDLELVDISSYEGAIFGLLHSEIAGQYFVVAFWGEEWELLGNPLDAKIVDLEVVAYAGIAVTAEDEEFLTLFAIYGSEWLRIEYIIPDAVRSELVYRDTFYLGVSMSNEGTELAKVYDMAAELDEGHVVGGARANISWINSFEPLGDNLVVAGSQRGDSGLRGGGVWLFDPTGELVEDSEIEEEVDEEVESEESSEEEIDSQEGSNSGGTVSQVYTVDNDTPSEEESEEDSEEGKKEDSSTDLGTDNQNTVSGIESNSDGGKKGDGFLWWIGIIGGSILAIYFALRLRISKK